MDGKYAKYIPSSFGFITKLEIEDDVLYVYTKENIKGKPHKYPLREKIEEYSERLENQYRLITEEENLQIIKRDLEEDLLKKQKLSMAISATLVALSCIYLGVTMSVIASILVGLGGAAIITRTHLIAMKKIVKNFDEEMDMVRTYLSSRSDIEKMSKKDPNVTRNLKLATINRIDINNELNKDDMIPEIFDITLLDDLISKTNSKKELKKLLTNYMICVALRQPQVFVNPNEEQKVIVRSKYDHREEETIDTKDAYTRGRRPNNK